VLFWLKWYKYKAWLQQNCLYLSDCLHGLYVRLSNIFLFKLNSVLFIILLVSISIVYRAID